MANNAANLITYYLLLDRAHENLLANLRQWNLTIGFYENEVWVKGIDHQQLNSVQIKSIPYKTLFVEKGGKLYLINSQLPQRNIPSLLWTPIERALPVTLPAFNFNYFGMDQKIFINLVPSKTEIASVAMITSLRTFREFIETAPSVRLKNLSWCLLNNDKIFVLGNPLLPLPGKVYWQRNNSLLPAGYDYELFLLSDSINNLLNPDNDCWIIWDMDNTYSLIEKDQLESLSISSFRSTMRNFTVTEG